MNTKTKALLFGLLLTTLFGCGGGGGSSVESSACNALKIAGGDSCEPVPGVAALFLGDSNGNLIGSCSGVYISLDSVLTAAHCFAVARTVTIATRGAVRGGAASILIHPLYDGTISSPFDFAILKVKEPVTTAPVPLLFSRVPVAGDQAVAYGYGVDELGQSLIERINAGQLPLKATTTTFVGYDSGTSAIISTGEGSTCPGDSGGPVLAQNPQGDYGIIGITRAGPKGCSAARGTPSLLSSTQSKGAIDFITSNVPDAATN